ncbi:DUF1648 domain-containing protein [Microbacterium mangrovi]|uniref:DUF1648 domain-containing protein n=1 Tax=Microbacterium mangrovi TaxID=1348253 RepID=UPI0018CD4D53|nr:DUF1648 domain-containing protein [Microbacterium mangrovi]
MSVLVSFFTWPHKPSRIAVHWNSSGLADSWASPSIAVLIPVAFGATLGLLCTLVIGLNHDDIPRWKGALGFAAAGWFLGTIAWIWFPMMSAARAPGQAAEDIAVVLGAGVLYGLVLGFPVALPRYVAPRIPPGSSQEEPDN